jgi:hypothetical protein
MSDTHSSCRVQPVANLKE